MQQCVCQNFVAADVPLNMLKQAAKPHTVSEQQHQDASPETQGSQSSHVTSCKSLAELHRTSVLEKHKTESIQQLTGLVQMPRCSLCAAVADTARSAAEMSSEPRAALAAALTSTQSQMSHISVTFEAGLVVGHRNRSTTTVSP